jgi:serine phosphatase RsbU (regulator of sigma subunit)/DNA-binding response OmpR family regulator
MNTQEAVIPISEPRQPDGNGVRILIVDDEPGNRETLADIFAEMGYHPETAATGLQALEKVQQRFYNIAVLDIRLPDMNGTELLAQIKELQPDTTCIMVTGYASLQTSIRATNAGAYAYIIKPLDIDHVSGLLKQALEQQRLLFDNRRLLQQFKSLSEVTDIALAALDLNEVLRSLLLRFLSAVSADAGAILLLDDATRRLEVRAAEGVARNVGFGVRAAGDHSFLDRVARASGPIVVADALNDPAADPELRSSGIRSMLGVPLRVQDRLIGVAHVDTFRPNGFSQEEIDLFDVLATRSALLIDNARLYEQERRLHREAEAMAASQRRIAEEMSTLYDVAQALVRDMGLDERLMTLAGHLVRVMGTERCIIWLFEQDALVPSTMMGVPADEREARRRLRIEPEEVGPRLKEALERNAITYVPDATTGELVTGDLPARWDMRSVLLLPMVSSGRAIGAVWLDQPGESRQFSPEQLRLAEAIAGQAAVAIENAQTFEQERTVASTLQQSFLPRSNVDLLHFEVQSRYVPAYTAAQVGGDYYDFIELPGDRLGVVMGDVCGKGVTAAVFTAMAKYELRAYAVEDPSPASVVTRLNRSLYSQMSEDCMFITLVYGVLDLQTGEFTYVNAAHPHPLVYDPTQDEVIELGTTGGMVGALPTMEFHEARTQLDPGAVLLLFTDGVTEARTGHEMLEIQGVQEVLRRAAGGSATAVCDTVFQRALDFSGGNLKDDVAIVAIRARERNA